MTDSICPQRACSGISKSVTFSISTETSADCSPMRFSSPTTFFRWGSDLCWVFLARLRYAFRFSQPLDVLFRPHPFGLFSCRIRPWGCGSQRFLPFSSRHGFSRALPSGICFETHGDCHRQVWWDMAMLSFRWFSNIAPGFMHLKSSCAMDD